MPQLLHSAMVHFVLHFRLGRKRHNKDGNEKKVKSRMKRCFSRFLTSKGRTSEDESTFVNAADEMSVITSQSAPFIVDVLPQIESTYLPEDFRPRQLKDPFLSILEHGKDTDSIKRMVYDVADILSLFDNLSHPYNANSRAIVLLQFLELQVAIDEHVPTWFLTPTPPVRRDWQAFRTKEYHCDKVLRTLKVYHHNRRRLEPLQSSENTVQSHRQKMEATQTLFRAYFGRYMPMGHTSIEGIRSHPKLLIQPINVKRPSKPQTSTPIRSVDVQLGPVCLKSCLTHQKRAGYPWS